MASTSVGHCEQDALASSNLDDSPVETKGQRIDELFMRVALALRDTIDINPDVLPADVKNLETLVEPPVLAPRRQRISRLNSVIDSDDRDFESTNESQRLKSLVKSFSMVLLTSTFVAGTLVSFLSLMVDIAGDDFQADLRNGQVSTIGGTLLGLLALAIDLGLAALAGVNAARVKHMSSFPPRCDDSQSDRVNHVNTLNVQPPSNARKEANEVINIFALQLRLKVCILLQLFVAILFDASMVFFITSYDIVTAFLIGTVVLFGIVLSVYDLLFNIQ